MIKKLLSVLFAASILLVPFTGCSGVSRENTLKIYNCADYIDESLVHEDFKEYYEEKYTKKSKFNTKPMTPTKPCISKSTRAKKTGI